MAKPKYVKTCLKCKKDGRIEAKRCNDCGNWFGADDEEFKKQEGKTFFYRWICIKCGNKNARENERCGCGGLQNQESCYLASQIYGEHSQEVQELRLFRDQYLLPNPFGYLLVYLYYSVSPQLKRIAQVQLIRNIIHWNVNRVLWLIRKLPIVVERKGHNP